MDGKHLPPSIHTLTSGGRSYGNSSVVDRLSERAQHTPNHGFKNVPVSARHLIDPAISRSGKLRTDSI